MSSVTAGRRASEREGFLFALALDRDCLRLRIFGFLTVAWVRLDTIRYIRQRAGREILGLVREGIRHPFRSWYWPRPGVARGVHHSTPFMIATRSGRKVYVRLRPGFHHRLRTAIGEVRASPDD